MQLIFIYGAPASGKLTIARELGAITKLPVFHNHLVVDAVAALFPFGTPAFVRLREQWWLQAFREAAAAKRSLIFTFAPEPSVADDFPKRVIRTVEDGGGSVSFIALNVPPHEQEKRLLPQDRTAFGKLRSLEILRDLRPQFEACMAAMPTSALRIDTGAIQPGEAARLIATELKLNTAW